MSIVVHVRERLHMNAMMYIVHLDKSWQCVYTRYNESICTFRRVLLVIAIVLMCYINLLAVLDLFIKFENLI